MLQAPTHGVGAKRGDQYPLPVGWAAGKSSPNHQRFYATISTVSIKVIGLQRPQIKSKAMQAKNQVGTAPQSLDR